MISPFVCNFPFSPKKRQNFCVTRQYESKRPLRIILRSLNWILGRIFLLHLTLQRSSNFNKFSRYTRKSQSSTFTYFLCHDARQRHVQPCILFAAYFIASTTLTCNHLRFNGKASNFSSSLSTSYRIVFEFI